jgi:hypothetical protein
MNCRVADDVPSKDYVEALQRVIVELHGCSSEHVETVQVLECFVGKIIWQGNVEIFEVFGHPRAQRCFAWIQARSQKQKRIRFFAVLGTRVIKTALDAVKVVRLAKGASLINELSKVREYENKPQRA